MPLYDFFLSYYFATKMSRMSMISMHTNIFITFTQIMSFMGSNSFYFLFNDYKQLITNHKISNCALSEDRKVNRYKFCNVHFVK